MNIFATYSCPKLSAQALDDKRVVKMRLESAQMLSTACHLMIGREKLELEGIASTDRLETFFGKAVGGLYAITHHNHPCNVWVRKCPGNFWWLYDHGIALCNVYHDVYLKPQETLSVIYRCAELYSKYINHDMVGYETTPFANCAAHAGLGLDFKHLPVHDAYKAYLAERWKTDSRPPTWRRRDKPDWLED